MKITLLGTGGPRPDLKRHGSSIVVQVGRDQLLFDAGRGATMQLVRAGVPPESLRAIFITHHHFDHIASLADVILAGWNNGGETPPLIFGPQGTERIIKALLNDVYGGDIASRLAEAALSSDYLSDIRGQIVVRDVEPGLVYDSGDWRVYAAHVDHMHGLGVPREEWACYGYRLEAGGQVIAISGDTVDCEGLQHLAREADVLVQCCYLAAAEMTDPENDLIAKHMLTCSPQVGKIATRAGVKQLVLTHFREKSEEMMESLAVDVRQDFKGDLILGQDLMTIDLVEDSGQSQVV